MYRTYTQKERRHQLTDGFNMDTGTETESGSPKNNLPENCKKERQDDGWKTWTEVKQVAKDRTSWRKSTEALWAVGPKEER